MLLQKAFRLRSAIPVFREEYGEENCIGIDQAVQTDFMSSEVTDEESSPQGNGINKKLNVRPIGWRDKKVSNNQFCSNEV